MNSVASKVPGYYGSVTHLSIPLPPRENNQSPILVRGLVLITFLACTCAGLLAWSDGTPPKTSSQRHHGAQTGVSADGSPHKSTGNLKVHDADNTSVNMKGSRSHPNSPLVGSSGLSPVSSPTKAPTSTSTFGWLRWDRWPWSQSDEEAQDSAAAKPQEKPQEPAPEVYLHDETLSHLTLAKCKVP